MQYIRMMEKRNIDELIILDIEATNEGRLIDADRIKDYTKELYCPVTLGGGIKSLDDINRLLNAGADKVSIQSNKHLISEAAKKFGAQAVVACIDHLDDYDDYYYPCSYSRHYEKCGAGEIILIDEHRDGTMEGYNIEAVKMVSCHVNIPVIAASGCSDIEDMAAALRAGAHAVAAGSMFLFTDTTPKQCARELKAMGFNTRVEQ